MIRPASARNTLVRCFLDHLFVRCPSHSKVLTIGVVLDRIGYSGEEVTECRTAQTKALRRAQEAMVDQGGFNWQLLTQVNAVSKSQCVDRMRSMCSEPRYQQRVA